MHDGAEVGRVAAADCAPLDLGEERADVAAFDLFGHVL